MSALKRIAATAALLIIISTGWAAPANAVPGIETALSVITAAHGHYVWAAASPAAADCSGLVSVAQSIAMGQPPHRLGDTHSLLAGHWPGAIPGASPDDAFVIGVSPSHMVARIDGVGIEARTKGQPYLIGDQAASPWDQQFTRQYHIDPALLIGDSNGT
jgi:hypothetical protein